MYVTTPQYFFIHVMKTGGSTFSRHILENFPADAVYPNRSTGDPQGSYWSIPQFLALSPERHARTAIYRGHFPYYITELTGRRDLVRLTVLRDPVDRVVSMLRQTQRLQRPDASLENIYSEYAYRRRLVTNFMTKMFAMNADDKAVAYYKILPMDRERLDVAKANLARVDVIGFQEQYGDFLRNLRSNFGWRIGEVESQRVGDNRDPVSDAFLDRITEDNDLDRELYEHAREIASKRAGALPSFVPPE